RGHHRRRGSPVVCLGAGLGSAARTTKALAVEGRSMIYVARVCAVPRSQGMSRTRRRRRRALRVAQSRQMAVGHPRWFALVGAACVLLIALLLALHGGRRAGEPQIARTIGDGEPALETGEVNLAPPTPVVDASTSVAAASRESVDRPGARPLASEAT